MKAKNTGGNQTRGLRHQIPPGLNQTNFTVEFDMLAKSYNGGEGSNFLSVSLTSNADYPWVNESGVLTTNDAIILKQNSNNSSTSPLFFTTDYRQNSVYTPLFVDGNIALNQRYFIRFCRLSATRGYINIFTDSLRTSPIPGFPKCFNLSVSLQPPNYIWHSCVRIANFDRDDDAEIDNLRIYNGAPPVNTISVAYPTSICSNGPTITPTSFFPTGGIFSSSPGLTINPLTGAINPTTSMAGTYTISYTAPGVNCPPLATTTITIAPQSAVSFSYPATVCSGAAPLSPISATPSGGVFSSTAGLSIDASTGIVTPSTSTPGPYTITYSVTNGSCAPVVSTISINVLPSPIVTLDYPSTICTSSSLITANSASPNGGTFSSSSGLIINPATGAINTGASTPGSYSITYSVTANGCNSIATDSVIIISTPVATLNYPLNVCTNGPPLVTGIFSPTGGVFSSTVGLALNGTNGVITPGSSTPGIYTVNYVVNTAGCKDTATATVTVTAPPTVILDYPTASCANSAPLTPISATPAGGTFSSTGGLSINSLTGAINPSASIPGRYTLTYSVTVSGCTSTSTDTITIVPNPTVTLNYPASACASDPAIAPIIASPVGGVFGSTVGLSLNTITGTINPLTSIPGTYTITYSLMVAGCTSTSTDIVTINANPAVLLNYPLIVCSNSLPVAPIFAPNGGIFASTPGLAINSSTGTINPSASTAGVYTITYSVTSGGCLGSSSTTLTIVPTLTINLPQLSDTVLCEAGQFTFQPPIPGSYTLTNAINQTIGSNITGPFTISITRPNVITYTYSIPGNQCATPTSRSFIIGIQAPILGRDTLQLICSPLQVKFSFSGNYTYNAVSFLETTTTPSSTSIPDTTIYKAPYYYRSKKSPVNSAINMYARAQRGQCLGPWQLYTQITPLDLNQGYDVDSVDLATDLVDYLYPRYPRPPFVGVFKSNNDGLSIDTITGDISLVNSVPGKYIIKIASKEVCSEIKYNTITLYQSKLKIPNVITPNGDGFNDGFTLKTRLKAMEELVIFNRWGGEVFRSQDPAFAWKANDVPAGIYYYYISITATSPNGSPIKQYGWISVTK
jgi:gliding motility-associated-like protein